MKQTAVEWLVENLHLHNDVYFVTKDKRKIIEKANEMINEQIKDAHLNGQSEWDIKSLGDIQKKLSEQYYEETYKIKKL